MMPNGPIAIDPAATFVFSCNQPYAKLISISDTAVITDVARIRELKFLDP